MSQNDLKDRTMKTEPVKSALDIIGRYRLLPVVVLDSAESADPLAEALLAGGLPIAEVTLRTDAAEDSIKAMSRHDGLLVGAGTVLDVEQAKRAIGAGAAFVVAPGTNPSVVEYCISQGVPITPGIATPSDIELARGLGLNILKFFPAEAFGGVKTLKALSAPYGDVRFIPTGGVSTKNLRDYLALPSVLACGGSWMVDRKLVGAGDFDTVQSLIADAVILAGPVAGG
jgi:2-dehydro-3-deoxyphosphogluconate aldolase/(4S)-4-hydroxy-2-oxoglutarate aldolase